MPHHTVRERLCSGTTAPLFSLPPPSPCLETFRFLAGLLVSGFGKWNGGKESIRFLKNLQHGRGRGIESRKVMYSGTRQQLVKVFAQPQPSWLDQRSRLFPLRHSIDGRYAKQALSRWVLNPEIPYCLHWRWKDSPTICIPCLSNHKPPGKSEWGCTKCRFSWFALRKCAVPRSGQTDINTFTPVVKTNPHMVRVTLSECLVDQLRLFSRLIASWLRRPSMSLPEMLSFQQLRQNPMDLRKMRCDMPWNLRYDTFKGIKKVCTSTNTEPFWW